MDGHNKMVYERKAIMRKLKGVTFKLINKNYVIKKDGNKVGNKKYNFFLTLYAKQLRLKININTAYKKLWA